MDAKFLTSQLVLASNIAQTYIDLVPPGDWVNLVELATAKSDFITNIITSEVKERRRNKGSQALEQFNEVVLGSV